jgi:hypothetical protein
MLTLRAMVAPTMACAIPTLMLEEYPPMYIETPPPYELPPNSVLTLVTQPENQLFSSSIDTKDTSNHCKPDDRPK